MYKIKVKNFKELWGMVFYAQVIIIITFLEQAKRYFLLFQMPQIIFWAFAFYDCKKCDDLFEISGFIITRKKWFS